MQPLNTLLLHEVVVVLRYKTLTCTFIPMLTLFSSLTTHTCNFTLPRFRCLRLRQTDASLFNELMLFESHVAERSEDPDVEERVSAVANVVINELRIDGVLIQGCNAYERNFIQEVMHKL